MSIVISPITKNSNVKLIKSFNSLKIIKEWKKYYKLDIAYLFDGIKEINVYECNETGFRFFYPMITGDSTFYGELNQFNWYYMPWKWEYEKAITFLMDGMQLLEVGCGAGHFLEHINSRFHMNLIGIELSDTAIKLSRNKGFQIEHDSIENFSIANKDKFDVVCSFQVLEHIASVNSFIEASVNCLKPNGRMIISVPNNGSFISETEQILNMPPHHVGLWDEISLISLQKYFPISLEKILYEPIMDYHYHSFEQTVYRKTYKVLDNNKYLRKMYSFFVGKPLLSNHLQYVRKWIPGHTIMAVFIKQ